jgi:fumarylacetoacetate (FAA) hydrolase
MKLISYLHDEQDQLGFLVDDKVYNMREVDWNLPDNMELFLYAWEDIFEHADNFYHLLVQGLVNHVKPKQLSGLHLLSPVPRPTSMRDAYAFRQHVEAARKNRGLEMIPEFDEYPVFYFTNHNAVQGPGDIVCMPDHFKQLDFELETAIVISKRGRNVTAEEADNYIGGYMIMNDMSARVLQMEEMKLNLGPAKGKDFCTALGPILVTPDELEDYKVDPRPGHIGNSYSLDMKCLVNGKQVSQGNMRDMDWTFAEIIERCAYGTDIMPGDVIGSGTVGTGCFLELNGTGKRLNPNYEPQWLQEGDEIEMEVTGLGKLVNKIVKDESDFSILEKKKMESAT